MEEQGQTANAGAGGTAGKPSMMATGTSGGAGGSSAGKGGSGTSSGTSGEGSSNKGEGGSGSSSMSSDGKSGSGASSGGSGGMAAPKPTVKVVPACMGRAGEMVCDGAKMIKCGEMFEAAETQACQNEARCRAGLEAGKCGACDPGVVQCMEADLYECNMAGEMVMTQHCDSTALCDDIGKKCDPAACKMDEYKCEGGELLRCLDDLTDFESKTSCPMELCDATGKKCNECLPSSKMCVGDKLQVCSADGSGMQEMSCPNDKPMCVGDKCVQCMDDGDCKAPNSCQTTSCKEGTCTPPQNKQVGTQCSDNNGKVCSLLGECVACNTDLDCSNSQRCSAVFGCIERAALTVIPSLLPGTYTVQVNAGYGMKISQVSSDVMALRVTWSGGGKSGVTAVAGDTVLDKLNSTRTVTFRGPTGQQAGLGGFSVNCTGFATLDGTGATLQFARDEVVDMMPVGMCTDQIIGLTATQ